MKYFKNILVFFLVLAFNAFTFGRNNYSPQIKGAKVVTYKSVDGIDLNLWIFHPPKHQSSDKKPAIVFCFWGGWSSRSPRQFVPHCEYLAARSMVAMVADYRVFSRNKVKINKCVTDAKSSIRWVREHSSELGIDPDKIVSVGGSAGGHLAAATVIQVLEKMVQNVDISPTILACAGLEKSQEIIGNNFIPQLKGKEIF